MLRKLNEKRNNRAGFTMAETLMTVLILLMVTAVVAGGIPAAVNAFDRVIVGSNAQVLLSTAMTRLREELGTATDIQVSAAEGEEKNTVIEYTAADGSRSRIYLSKADGTVGIHLWQYMDTLTEDGEPNTRYDRLLVSKAASNKDRRNPNQSLYIVYDSVSWTETQGRITSITFHNLRVINPNGRDTGSAQVTELTEGDSPAQPVLSDEGAGKIPGTEVTGLKNFTINVIAVLS